MSVKWTLEEQWNGWAIKPETGNGFVTVHVRGVSRNADRTAFCVAAALNEAQITDEWINQAVEANKS